MPYRVIRLDLAVHVVVTRWNNGHLRIQKSQRWSSSQGLHLEAALAIVDYSQASARWIFGQATGNRLANLILWEMCRNPGGLSRDTILHEVCSGNTTKTQLNRALSELAKNKLAKMVLEKAG